MPDINDFSIGKQCTLVIQHPLAPGGRLELSIVTDFDAKPHFKEVSVDGLDGIYRSKKLPQYWDLSFGLDRANSAADDFGVACEAAYDATGNVPSGTVYQYIIETDGSQTTYAYTGVALTIEDAGSWKGDSAVKQKVMGRCTRRRRV